MKRIGMIALVLVGFIAGIAFVYSCGSGGNGAFAGVVKTGYFSIGHEGFHVEDPTASFQFTAPVNLPHNSKIKSITGYFTDTQPLGWNDLVFRTYGRDGGIINSQRISTELIFGYASVTLNFPDGLIIDNINNYYCLTWPIGSPPEIAFHSALIEYEYEG